MTQAIGHEMKPKERELIKINHYISVLLPSGVK